MAVAVFNSCCCCIELRLGCLIYGYLELIATIYSMISVLSLPKTMKLLVDELMKHADNTSEMREFVEVMETLIRVVMIITITCACIKLIFVVTFLVGLHQNKRGLVGVYLIATAIFFVIGLIVTSVLLFKLTHQNQFKIPDELVVTQIISCILTALLTIYFWMVIRSQYHKMDINTGNGQAVNYTA